MADPGALGAGAGDMFLMVKGAKGGVIKGEALDSSHKGEIDVLSWSWGMHSRPALSGGGASGKAAVHELKIVKRVDSASTALMSALRTNEMIVKAVLTLRKAGKNLTRAGFLLVVNPASPPKTLQEFVAWTKSRSGELNFGSAGLGSGGHLAGELYKHMTGVSAAQIQ